MAEKLNKTNGNGTGWVSWLVVLLVSALSTCGLMALLSKQGAAGSVIVFGVGATFIAYWLVKGMFQWRENMVVKRISIVAMATLGLVFAGVFKLLGMPNAAMVFVGIYAMVVSLYLGLQLIKFLLSGANPICGVARTLVDEAVRMKTPLVFIVVLVMMLPILPFVIDQQDFLKYRIQTFITASMIVVTVLLSLMTIFLAVQTITSEIQFRQIYLTLTKPVGRAQYLLGKWLGIVLLNAVLVLVCGIVIYSFSTMLAKQQALDEMDRLAVDQQIMVARLARQPVPLNQVELAELYAKRIEQLRYEDPDVYGLPGSSLADVPSEIATRVQSEILEQWHSLPAREAKTYVFTGLLPAKPKKEGESGMIQLRLYPKAMGSTADRTVTIQVRVNDRPYFFPNITDQQTGGLRLADEHYHVLDMSTDVIDDKGEVRVTLSNPVLPTGLQPTINFKTADGLEVYYKVGSFGGNLAKSMVMIWLRLVFLAMLGLTMGSFLGFPTACLGALMILAAAAGSEFLFESLGEYASFPRGDLSWSQWISSLPGLLIDKFQSNKPMDGVRVIVRLIGTSFMQLVPRFGYYSPTGLLSEGKVVPSGMVMSAILWLGVIWTFVVGLIGYMIFRLRELARVTV